MTSIKKNIRHYYWLSQSFIKKNIKLLLISFVGSFLFIFLFISFSPFITNLFLAKNEKIGLVGQKSIRTIPDSIASLISNPLITINSKGEIIPVLAQSWELLNKGQTYRFHLKKNLTWSNGKPFVASDINYEFKGIETKVLDSSTIEFNLPKPLSIFPVYLTKPIIKYPLLGVAGLYQAEHYKTNKSNLISLSLSPNRTEIPYKTYFFYETEDKMITGYKTGEINTFTTHKKSISDIFKDWRNSTIVKTVDYNQILTLFFNNDTPFLSKDNKDVRKGLAYATPKFETLGEEANGPIPPLSWAYVPDLKKYPYNLDRARNLLKKNLGASGSAELNFYTFYDYLNVGEEIKKNYEDIGLKINLKVLSYLPQSYDMLLTLWSPPIDPDQYYFWHSTQADGNITNYKNVKVDKLLEDGRSIIDLTERKRIYEDFQRAIVEDVPAYFIYYPYIYTVERK
jgi:peptide/nickel transport system substrate-binding protein